MFSENSAPCVKLCALNWESDPFIGSRAGRPARKSPPAAAAELNVGPARVVAPNCGARTGIWLEGASSTSATPSLVTGERLTGERASERVSEFAYLSIIPLEILERVWYHRSYSLGSVS